RRLLNLGTTRGRSTVGTSALLHGELAKTNARIRRGPAPNVRRRARFGRAQLLARKAVLRLIKPFTVHERIVDEELVRAIAALGDGLAGAHMRIDELNRNSNANPRRAAVSRSEPPRR